MARGYPIDRSAWPSEGAVRAWLEHLDALHRSNGLRSQREVARTMGLATPTRVGEMLRGRALPADRAQARALAVALGAVGNEVDRAVRLYERCERTAARAQPDDSTAWWPRSGYRALVADIAPAVLLEREDELRELAAFCGGDEPYVWWQADARAGKSALLSWFVLHPPPSTVVLSFFVTARLASQSDSSAFTDAMLDQLSAVTGQPPPPVITAAGRTSLWRQLLAGAADSARRQGRRLVLVVDGLDEDCGVRPGSGLASIAALLPVRPVEGLRVVVSGRPHPPLPPDVGPDHPLRWCAVRPLAASPHARQLTALAERELDDLLAADADRHGGLGYDVLGLVTAAGGGLRRADLEYLTGRAPYELDALRRGVFGRTIADRTLTYVFTHETLRVRAIDRLGPVVLSRFRARLHAWADGYRDRRWPEDTPAYLLHGYQRMLRDAGDAERLATLATDVERHDRMLATSGGDATPLAEIVAAQEALAEMPDAQLAVAVRLAIHRDELVRRNGNVPPSLPAVWLRLGQRVRAETLADRCTDAYRRCLAYGEMATVAGEYAADTARAAEEVIGRTASEPGNVSGDIADPFRRATVLSTAARAWSAAGDLAAARALVERIEQRACWDRAVSSVATALAAAGDHDGAQAALTPLTGPSLAVATAAVADRELSTRIGHPGLRAETLTALGHGEEARPLALAVTHPYWRHRALTAVARALRDAALADLAAQAVARIKNPIWRARALADNGWTAACLGDRSGAVAALEAAGRVAHGLTDPARRTTAFARLAEAAALAGDEEHASRWAEAAERESRGIWAIKEHSTTLELLFDALVAAADVDRALAVARRMPRQVRSDDALVMLARRLAADGRERLAAEVLAGTALTVASQLRTIPMGQQRFFDQPSPSAAPSPPSIAPLGWLRLNTWQTLLNWLIASEPEILSVATDEYLRLTAAYTTPAREPSGYTIVLVEDEPTLNRALCRLLEGDGHEVVGALDGPAAVDKIWALEPDLVVLNLNLPGLHGFQVLERIREQCDVPVVIETAEPWSWAGLFALWAGADGYIQKPTVIGLQERVEALYHESARPPLWTEPEQPQPLDSACQQRRGPRAERH